MSSHAAGAAWVTPARPVPLSSSSVSVWIARVGTLLGQIERCRRTLSSDEIERADAFRIERDRRSLIIAHGLVRSLLSHYVNRPAAELRFASGEFGKPALVGYDALRFNLSHSDDLIAIAVTPGREVGVDVERIDEGIEADLIAKSFFSRAERESLGALDGRLKVAGFFRCWTQKEAYMKATGLGISAGLDGFDVRVAPDEPAALLSDRRDPSAVVRWTLRDLDTRGGYAGAIAAEGTDWRLERLVVTPSQLGWD